VILDALLPALTGKGSLPESYARLSQETQRHLSHLLYTARQAALTLQRSQPQTPLGFLKGPKGVLSNMLMASWIDLTIGGKLHVDFEPIGDQS